MKKETGEADLDNGEISGVREGSWGKGNLNTRNGPQCFNFRTEGKKSAGRNKHSSLEL